MSEEYIAFVTKYALSTGVFRIDGRGIEPEGFTYRRWGYPEYAHGVDVQLTEADAKKDFERRRTTKIASLRKQIAKLEKLTFTFKDLTK